MKVRAFKEWFDQQVYENPELLNMELGYIDVARGTWFTGLVLQIIERKKFDQTINKEVEIDGM